MDAFINDLRYALRTLIRSPGFSLAAVLTLALGIGANTAVFSVVDGVLLRPSPFASIDQLTMVWQTDRNSGTTREPSSIPDYFDFRTRNAHFAELAAFTSTEANLTREGADPGRVAALAVSTGFLGLLGIQPIAGRLLTDEETRAGGARSVLISEDLWESQFARDAGVTSKIVRLNDTDWNVVGVLPRTADFGTLQILSAAAYGRGFADRGGRPRVDVWFGLRASTTASRDNHPIIVVGRLKAQSSVASAQQDMTVIASDLERAFPSNTGRGVFVEPMKDVIFGPVKPALMVLLGAVVLVLLVACGNVANLLLVRGAGRLREVTVRMALGAGSRRLMRQFMTESAVLTVSGAVLGVMFAQFGLQALLALAPSSLPRVGDVGIDSRVLLVTLLLSVAVAVVFGTLPVLQSRRRNLNSALQGGSSRGASAGPSLSRLRGALVVAELSMAVMLMVGAGLLIRSLWQLQRVDPGFIATGVLKAEFQLPQSRYPQNMAQFPNWTAHQNFFREVQTRLSAEPGVTGVALAVANPLDAGFTSSIRVVGRENIPANWPEPSIRNVSTSYFATMSVPVVQGRAFAESDAPTSAPVIMVNRASVERYFDGQDPLGQRVFLWGAERTVIGVVGNEHVKGISETAPPAVYLPLTQTPLANTVLVRTQGDPAQLANVVRRIVRDLDPLLPLFGVEPLSVTLSNSVGQRRFTMLTLGAFAAVALLLAVIGVHGVLSYTVSQRTREIGIRMALGAAPSGVRTMIVREGAILAAAGLTLGIGGAIVITGALSTMLFGVTARDPLTFALVAAVLGVVALVASYLPAARAARTNPLTALRAE